MDDTQNKNYKLHHKAIKFLVTFISFKEYKKISNIESTKTIYDSLRFNYEGNKQVKESKANYLKKKYKLFKMNKYENVETIFSIFQTLVSEFKLLNKVILLLIMSKNILRSMPKKWRI